jgi:hypothetical protein
MSTPVFEVAEPVADYIAQTILLVTRRRLKELKFGAYSTEEAERVAGRGVDNKQRGVEPIVSHKKEEEDEITMEAQEQKASA